MGRSRLQGVGRSWKLASAFFALLVVLGQGCTNCSSGNGKKGSDCKSNGDCNDPLQCCQTEYCADLQTDNQNCGRCDNGCPDQTYCNNGECLCGLVKCPGTQHCCGNACVPWNEAHCGSCGSTCPTDAQCCAGSDGTLGCTAPNDRLNCGGCGLTCLPEDECCGGKCADDDANCGKCGRGWCNNVCV